MAALETTPTLSVGVCDCPEHPIGNVSNFVKDKDIPALMCIAHHIESDLKARRHNDQCPVWSALLECYFAKETFLPESMDKLSKRGAHKTFYVCKLSALLPEGCSVDPKYHSVHGADLPGAPPHVVENLHRILHHGRASKATSCVSGLHPHICLLQFACEPHFRRRTVLIGA